MQFKIIELNSLQFSSIYYELAIYLLFFQKFVQFKILGSEKPFYSKTYIFCKKLAAFALPIINIFGEFR